LVCVFTGSSPLFADSDNNYQIFLDGYHRAGRVINETPAQNFALATAVDEGALANFLRLRADLASEMGAVKTTFNQGKYRPGPCMTTSARKGAGIDFWESNCVGLNAHDFARQQLRGLSSHFIGEGSADHLANAASRAFNNAQPVASPRVNELLACDYTAKGIKSEVEKLLNAPASVSPVTVCANADRLLHTAIRYGRWPVAELLLAHSVEVDAKNAANERPIDLIIAQEYTEAGQQSVFGKILKRSNEKPSVIAQALLKAIRWNNQPMFAEFLAYGVNTPEIDNWLLASTLGLSVYRSGGWAAYWGSGGDYKCGRTANYVGAGWILDAKLADVNAAVTLPNKLMAPVAYSPLLRVVRQTFTADVTFMDRLVKAGAKTDLADPNNFTAYDWVCSYKQLYLNRCLDKVQNPKCLARFDQQMQFLSPALPPYRPVPENLLATAASNYTYYPAQPAAGEFKFDAWCYEGLKECK